MIASLVRVTGASLPSFRLVFYQEESDEDPRMMMGRHTAELLHGDHGVVEFLVIVLVSIFLLVIRLQALETLLHLSFPLIISLAGFCVNLLKKPC